jgi:NADH-quinone oxidoreductase subunit E
MVVIQKEEVLAIIKQRGKAREQLLSILLEIQKASGNNYVGSGEAKLVAEELGLPLSKVYEVLTFYEMLASEPRGHYVIEICKSPPCQVVQEITVAEILEAELGIKMGETTEDQLFTLQYTYCLGACDQAPAIKIGDNIYGHLTREKIVNLIKQYRGEGR